MDILTRVPCLGVSDRPLLTLPTTMQPLSYSIDSNFRVSLFSCHSQPETKSKRRTLWGNDTRSTNEAEQLLELSSLPMTIRSCNVDVHTVKTKVFPCVFSSYILIAQSKLFSSGTRVLGFEKKYGFYRKNGYNWIIWPTSRHGDDLHRLNVVTKIPQQVQKYFQHAFGI